MRKFKLLFFFCFACLAGCAKADFSLFGSYKKQVTIGSKIFTENIMLAEMLAVLLEEKYGFQVTKKLNMGGTKLVFDALRNQQIDIYPEYTGTGYTMILNLAGETDPEKPILLLKKSF